MDISGQRFGRLTVLKKTRRKDAQGRCYLYRCRCDCGRTKLVNSPMLKSGMVRSCGCLQEESRKRDITGRRVGALVAVRPTRQTLRHSIVWVWQCDCGREVRASLDKVLYAGRRSCGCRNYEIKRGQALAMQEHCQRVDGTDLRRIRTITIPSNNTSGTVGVYYNTTHRKWYARLCFQGRQIWLGWYGSKASAIRARKRGEREIFGAFLVEYDRRRKK